MTEQNILGCKLFCHKIFKILFYFLSKNYNVLPWNLTPLFLSSPPLKTEVLSTSSFWKFGRRFNTSLPPHPPTQKRGCRWRYLLILIAKKLLQINSNTSVRMNRQTKNIYIKIELKNSFGRLICHITDIKIAWINPCYFLRS